MRTEKFEGYLIAESPIHQGSDESGGNEKEIRRQTYIVDGKPLDVPIVSGNSIRGVLRRMLMADMLDILGYKLSNTKTYHTLFSGGALTSVDTGDTGNINLEMRKKLRVIPPLSLLGTAIGNQMLEGKLKLGHAVPICRETMPSLYDHVKGVFPGHEKLSMYDYLGHEFLTRHDDLHDERGKDDAPVQMIANFEVLATGTPFYLRLDLHDCLDVEASCLARALNLWRERPYIGGMSAKGYGRIKIMFDTMDETIYLNYLYEHKDRITDVLKEIDGML